MLNNYIKTAIRRLLRNKAVSTINILGLTIGMAVTFVILIYVSHELSYDEFHTNKDRIYRVITEQRLHGWKNASTPYPLADKLEEDYPEVEKSGRLGLLFGTAVKKDHNFIAEAHFVCADPNFPEIFTLEVIRGTRNQLLNDPGDVVLTESMARKYFGTLDIVGRELVIENGGEEIVLNISGVIRDLPRTSTLKIDFLASNELYLSQIGRIAFSGSPEQLTPDHLRSSWQMDLFMTYLLAEEGFQPRAFEGQLDELEKSVFEDPGKKSFHVQAMEDFYFHSGELLSEFTVKGDVKNVYIFSAVALLILVIACINYILLGSSQALDRAREIGIRKITGADRKVLFRQVLVESLLVTLIAFPLALILIEQLRPLLIRFLEKDFIHYGALSWEILLGFALVLFFLSYLPGRFIVRFYTRISPAVIISRHGANGGHKLKLRKGMMAIQFTVFLILVSCSMGIYRQLEYVRSHNLGFDPEGVVSFSLGNRPDTEETFRTLKNELLKNPDVKAVGGSMWVLPTANTMSYDLPMPDNPEQSVSIDALYVDQDFTRVMGVELTQGRPLSDFSEERDDIVLINETAAQRLQMNDPIGRELGGFEIAGVIRDFHSNSFRKKISPLMLVKKTDMARNMLVKVSGAPGSDVLSYIEKTYQSVSGTSAFDHHFVSERFDTLYKSERKLAVLLMVFSGIAILISSMGLLGLTIFQTRKRTREIAIRKVNGAHIMQVMRLLSGNYLKMILFSAGVAIPFSYWILTQWLRSFAYQTNLSWWIFFGSVALAVAITLLTVSFQTYRAATANPTQSLRCE